MNTLEMALYLKINKDPQILMINRNNNLVLNNNNLVINNNNLVLNNNLATNNTMVDITNFIPKRIHFMLSILTIII